MSTCPATRAIARGNRRHERHEQVKSGAPPGVRPPGIARAVRHRLRNRFHAARYPEGGWRMQFQRFRRRIAWVAVGLMLAGIPLVVFALFGLPHLFRTSLVDSVTARELGGTPPAADSPQFALAFALLAGTPLTPGNAVEVMANGDGTFPRLWSDLSSAQRSITMHVYYAGSGAVADSMTRILSERARAGVKVFFLIDAFGGEGLPRRYLDALRGAGVHVAEFRPIRWYSLDRASHRSHVRGVTVDGTLGHTGGFGFDDKWLGTGRNAGEWRETNVRFEGPAVSQLQAAFIAEWAEATGELLMGDRLLAASEPRVRRGGGAQAALVYSPSVIGSTTAERLLALSIATARRRLYIANAYFVPDANFVQFLIASARRGVDVRILTNGAQSDVKTTLFAGRYRYESLLSEGVRVYEYRHTTMHAKTFVVDGVWSSVGTMNFDNRSLAYNNEVALVVLDSIAGAAMDSMFFRDLQSADEIRLGVFQQRSRARRLVEWAASAVSSLL